MKSNYFPDLGVGVGLRPEHYEIFSNAKPDSVSWVEVISENFMASEKGSFGRSLQNLERIRKEVPIVLHGVSMSLGSVDPINLSYLKRLRELIHRIEPRWISDHLSWTGVDGENLHDLIPLPYTREALDVMTDKILRTQDFLGQRILIENPSSYVEFSFSEMTEWEFMSELAERADCGILLDVNNVYVSSVNHGFDPIRYLESVPFHRVGQIHLAGHTNQNGFLIDTHDEPVCEEVWALYRWVVDRFGPISSMIERDAHIPAWEELEAEVQRIAHIRENRSFKNEGNAPLAYPIAAGGISASF
jgi:uncharacterized protein (UPF0276 family)